MQFKHTVTPYVKGLYPSLPGSDRDYIERELKKVAEATRNAAEALGELLVAVSDLEERVTALEAP
jgi:hypothetical protein